MRTILTIIILSFAITGYTQDIQLLSNFNVKSFRFTNIIEKDISEKWDYFSLTEVGSAFDATGKLSFESHHFANYALKNGFSLTAGLGLENSNILPQIGICYSSEKGSVKYAFYPTLHYGVADKQAGASLNSVIKFNPVINAKLDFYNLLLLDFDFDFGDAIQSQQYLNIGLEYLKKLHFGVNIDFEQGNNYNTNEIDGGVFLGFNF